MLYVDCFLFGLEVYQYIIIFLLLIWHTVSKQYMLSDYRLNCNICEVIEAFDETAFSPEVQRTNSTVQHLNAP